MKGILSILTSHYSGRSPHVILNSDEDLLTKLNIQDLVTANRRNGASHALKRMKELAVSLSSSLETKQNDA